MPNDNPQRELLIIIFGIGMLLGFLSQMMIQWVRNGN